jgi:hypothetical protein
MLYPQAPHIHYAVLNGRDFRVLGEAGVEAQRLHLLPNPVPPPAKTAERSAARAAIAQRFGIGDDRRYVLYPVRAIRRKNLGEALLWAAAAGSAAALGVTLPPLNPIEKPGYARWRAVAAELQIPCHFEVGGDRGLSLAENLAACNRVLTTSLAEGFGMVFLEACLAQRPLVGRDLPEVTEDFVRRGMTFDSLHSRLDVPLDWLKPRELLDAWARALGAALEAYGRRPPSQRELQECLDEKLRNGRVDFGDLDTALQERVLRRVCGERRDRHVLIELNRWLDVTATCDEAGCVAEAERNAAVVRAEYSLDASGRRLSEIYREAMADPRHRPPGALNHGERILDAFLRFARFRPVRI